MIRLFVSYSHADDAFRKRLETALALLKRQGLVDIWTDQAILPGQEIDPVIAAELEAADGIILLVSPDFLASNYCFDKEMTRALERHRAREAVVIPLIVRPCSWQQTPLGAVKAIPRDGKPVSKYDDPDDAWHEVETEIRRLIEALNRKRADTSASAPGVPAPARAPASAAVALPRSFSDADRDDFIDEAFDASANAFTASLQELESANPGSRDASDERTPTSSPPRCTGTAKRSRRAACSVRSSSARQTSTSRTRRAAWE